MNGLVTSRWRRTISCGLLTCAGSALGSSPALAGETPGLQTFADSALVTNWSLPAPRSEPRLLPEPAFGRSAEPIGAGTSTEARLAVIPVLPPPAEVGRGSPAMGATASATANASASIEEPVRRGAAGTAFTTYDRDPPYRMPRDIKRLEIAYQLVNAMDGATTIICLQRSDCEERNPIYGRHPKTTVVIGAKLLTGALHYLVTRNLAPNHPGLARFFGWYSVALQGGIVGYNMTQLF